MSNDSNFSNSQCKKENFNNECAAHTILIKLTLCRYYLWNHKFARALNQWHFRWEFNASQFHFVLMMDWLYAWKASQCEKSENKIEIETELNPYKLPSSSLCSRRSAAACPFGGIHAERKQQKCCIFIYTTEKLNVDC